MRLKDKVAVITGGAQGFGAGIAECMETEGCTCVIADLKGGVITDVTNERDVETLCDAVMERYGRLDIFVANAGILKAGGLDEMSLSDFELVTKVNYTAFFLCAKAAARVMKTQRAAHPERTFDIIQINSKSGLEGSNKNFAYAGGKFGGIGLVQSFAKELVGYGIKVNAICPGNYFEGPLWSDPERGLFTQYLNAGKVPGAKTIGDVKKFYEDKVPMRRGCVPLDVARAILYCVEQEYETGQAIPVTGGQVMLK
ncbi:MAG: SDR family NAD(P)-dependent oxidoreductase [Oscillospiraceae bacterium]|jgi:NAD(P)-dependent dehydrogenase (short-subunit alcohol dehydrogenase family)|nr:SDR family NAD(P)-dependent oxidoreductase [Oscillospiraceae bacterium]